MRHNHASRALTERPAPSRRTFGLIRAQNANVVLKRGPFRPDQSDDTYVVKCTTSASHRSALPDDLGGHRRITLRKGLTAWTRGDQLSRLVEFVRLTCQLLMAAKCFCLLFILLFFSDLSSWARA